MYSTSYASAATLIGRILIAAFFIPSGVQKIAGGLLFVYAFGPGRYSFDERSNSA